MSSERSALLIGWAVSAVIALTPVSALAGPLDANGFVRPDDAACWVNRACSLPRGGDSDVMTVYGPDAAILVQNFAFGFEEMNNIYYFDPAQVPINPAEYGNYTTLLEAGNGSWSDTYGVARFYGVPGEVLGWSWTDTGPGIPGFLALAFMSDPQDPANIPPTLDFALERPGILNPVPEPGEDSQWLTIPYDASRYLSVDWQEQGYRADFRSDIPEPGTLALLGLGLAGLAATRRRKQ